MATPAQSIARAVAAYNQAARGQGSGLPPRDDAARETFADLVKGAIKEAVRIGERSEALTIRGIQDRADLNQVVTAVAEAEVTLQTVVTIRDRVIEAYREILRMPM